MLARTLVKFKCLNKWDINPKKLSKSCWCWNWGMSCHTDQVIQEDLWCEVRLKWLHKVQGKPFQLHTSPQQGRSPSLTAYIHHIVFCFFLQHQAQTVMMLRLWMSSLKAGRGLKPSRARLRVSGWSTGKHCCVYLWLLILCSCDSGVHIFLSYPFFTLQCLFICFHIPWNLHLTHWTYFNYPRRYIASC